MATKSSHLARLELTFMSDMQTLNGGLLLLMMISILADAFLFTSSAAERLFLAALVVLLFASPLFRGADCFWSELLLFALTFT